MQLPTINSQNCFRVAYLVIYLFMHTCVGDREEKHQPCRMFLVCHTLWQPGGVHSCPPGGAAQFQGQDTPVQEEDGICDVGRAVVGGTWSSASGTMSLQHCEDPLWTTRKAQWKHPQAGHTGRTLLNSFQHGHITQSHWKMDLELSFLTASRKINVLILRVSFFQGIFPVGLEWASPVVTGQTAALYGTHLSLPWVWWTSHFSYLYNFPSPGWTSVNHSRPSEQTGRWQQLQPELPAKANRTPSHPKSHTWLSPGLEQKGGQDALANQRTWGKVSDFFLLCWPPEFTKYTLINWLILFEFCLCCIRNKLLRQTGLFL